MLKLQKRLTVSTCLILTFVFARAEALADKELDGITACLESFRAANIFRGPLAPNDAIGIDEAQSPDIFRTDLNVIRVLFANSSHRSVYLDLGIQCTDIDGRVFTGRTRQTVVPPGPVADVERWVYLPEGLPDGWYAVHVTFSDGASSQTVGTSIGRVRGGRIAKNKSNGFFGMSIAALDQGFRLVFGSDWQVANIADLLGASCYRAYDWFPYAPNVASLAWQSSQYRFARLYDKNCLTVLWPWTEMDADQFPLHIQGYETYARAYAKHFGDGARFYQNQNEPFTYYGYGPEFIAHRVKAFYNAIHAGMPNAVVIAPNIHVNIPLKTSAGWKWLEKYFEVGALDYLDRLGVMPLRFEHWKPRKEYPELISEKAKGYQDLLNEDLAKPFPYAEAVEGLPILYDTLVAEMEQYGRPKPIQISEVGLPGGDVLAPRLRAELTCKTIVHSLAHPAVKAMIWRILLDPTVDYHVDNLLVRAPSGNMAPTPAAVAYAVLAAELGDVELAAQTVLRDDTDKTYVYKFSGPRGEVVAAWSCKPGMKIAVAGGTRTVDYIGRELGSSEQERDLTSTPILIRGAPTLAVRVNASS